MRRRCLIDPRGAGQRLCNFSTAAVSEVTRARPRGWRSTYRQGDLMKRLILTAFMLIATAAAPGAKPAYRPASRPAGVAAAERRAAAAAQRAAAAAAAAGRAAPVARA